MQVPVLIVGGGPVGLTSSILLSRFGVRSLLVERHPSTSIHPKATGISTRSMELFRSWGLEPQIRDLELPVDFVSSIRSNLSAPEEERLPLGFPTREDAQAFTPAWPAVVAPDILEPVLVEHAELPCVGARLPHVWLDADGERLSTHDLTGSKTVLLTGPKGDAWRSAARSVTATLGVPLGAIAVGVAELRDISGDVLTRLGVDDDGALLVRPDGHIAWRSRGPAADPTVTLGHAVATTLGFDADDRAFFMALQAADGRRCA